MSTINNSNIGLVPGSGVRSISPITIGQQPLSRPTGISQPYTPINNLNPGLSLPQGSRIVGNPIPAQLMQARNINLPRPTSQYNIGTPTRVGAPNFQPIRSSQINSIQPPMQRRFVQNVTIPQPQISPVRNYIQAAPAPMPIPQPQMVRQIPFSPPPQPIVQQFARPNPIPMQPIFTPPPPPPTQSFVQQVPQTVQTHYVQQTIEDQPVEVRKSRWQNHYEEEQPAPPPPPVAASAPPTKSKCHPAIFGILGLLALAGLITGIIFALKGRNNNNQAATQAPGIPGTNILPQAQGGTVTVETTIIDKSQNSTTQMNQTNPTVLPAPAAVPSITPTPTSATVAPVPPITIPVTNIETKDPIRKDPILDTIFIPEVGTQQVQYKTQPGTVGAVQPDRIQSQLIGANGFTFPTNQGTYETVPTATQGSTNTIAPSTTNPQSGVANMDPNSFTSQFSGDAQSVKPTVVSTDPTRLPSHRVRRYID